MAALLLVMVYIVSGQAGKMTAGLSVKAGKEQPVVVLDAGHGGSDPGKIGVDGSLEKDINLKVVEKLKKYLEASDVRVVLTRDSDNGLYTEKDSKKKMADMNRRCEIINETNPALTVSIHQNSYHQEEISGGQVFYYKGSDKGKKLAEILQKLSIIHIFPVGKLLGQFALPAIISMLVNAVYNIVDQIFIGQGIGYLGNAATTIAFPIVTIILAMSTLLGAGGSAYAAIKLGEKREEEAERTLGTLFLLTLMASAVIMIVGFLFMDPMLKLFGATENTMDYARQYTSIILLGTPFNIMAVVLSNMSRTDGSPALSMYAPVSYTHLVSARGKCLSCLTAIRGGTGIFTVNHVGSDSKDGSSRNASAVGVVSFYVTHEGVD